MLQTQVLFSLPFLPLIKPGLFKQSLCNTSDDARNDSWIAIEKAIQLSLENGSVLENLDRVERVQ